jgi:hypothetical protein
MWHRLTEDQSCLNPWNVAIAGLAILAVIYTITHSSPDSNPVGIALDRVTASASTDASADADDAMAE